MNEITAFKKQFPQVVARGIDESTWLTLKQSLYAGAADESIIMVIDYCKSRSLDPLMKPVHIVPMSVKNSSGQYGMRDVVMPGINTYRIQASRSGDLAGISPPIFGDEITTKLGSINNFTYPEWCEIKVTKLIGDRLVDFTAREYFTENYATKKRGDNTPNSMWEKRPKGQLAKCAEAQALRKGWPEIGQQPTYEEMQGKSLEKDITPSVKTAIIQDAAHEPTTQEVFDGACDWIDVATNLGELQAKFAEGWKALTALKADHEKHTLKALYEEKKTLLEEQA